VNLTPTIPVEIIPTEKQYWYNPSVIEFNGRRLTSYRHHPDHGNWRTELCINKKPLTVPDHYKLFSQEDLRFFSFRGKLMASLTIARNRQGGEKVDPCICCYGELEESEKEWRFKTFIEPKHTDNAWGKCTKNVVFWQHEQNLYCSWHTTPAHVVHLLGDSGSILAGWSSESPKCSFGSYRGGTQLFDYQGNWLRFCHCVQNNPKSKVYWGYSLVAILIEPKPPFRILKVSQQPIITSNEAYTPGWRYWKPRIIVAYGAIKEGDDYLVSVGLNDSECAFVRVKPSGFNF